MSSSEQKRNNLRLAGILVSVVAVFFFGIFAKMILLGSA